jgi:hypothetical protein
MGSMIPLATLIVAGLCGVAPPAGARSETLMDLPGQRNAAACALPADAERSLQYRGAAAGRGNPTQDMTGLIGHAKSWQGNGGPRCKTICRFTGTQS